MNRAQILRAQDEWLNQLFANREHIHIPPFYRCCVPVSECLKPGLFTHRTRVPIDPPSQTFPEFDFEYVVEHKCEVQGCFLKFFRYRVSDDPNPGPANLAGITFEIEYDKKLLSFDGDTFHYLYVDWDMENEPVLERDKDPDPDSKEWIKKREFKFGAHSAWIFPAHAFDPTAHPDRSDVYPDMHTLAQAFEPMMFGPVLHPIVTLQAWLRKLEQEYPRRAPLRIGFHEEDY
jgi:hypothetical protein